MGLGSLALVAAVFGAPPNLPPVALVGRADPAPVVDGSMGDPAWQQAAILAPFVQLGTASLPTQQTVARICYDDARIYVGFWCWEDDSADQRLEAKARDASNAWSDDCAEVFLAPDGRGEVYYHVIVTAAGVITDETAWRDGARRDLSWDFAGQAAIGRWPQGWTCEVAIPRAGLGSPPLEAPWLASFARNEHPHGELSAWPSLLGGFHEAERFGLLRWADKPLVTGLSVPPPSLGTNRLRVTFVPGAEADLQAAVIRGGREYPKPTVYEADTASVFVAEEGEAFLRLTAEPRGKTKAPPSRPAGPGGRRVAPQPQALFATPPVRFYTPPVTPVAEEAASYLAQARAALATVGDRDTRDLAARLRTTTQASVELSQDLAVARLGGGDRGRQWDDLAAQAGGLAHDAFLLAAEARTAARAPRGPLPGFALGWQTPLVKLRRDDRRVHLAGAIQLSACRGEGESAQVVAIGLAAPSHVEKVGLSPIRRVGTGEEIPAQAVRVFRVDYVHTRPPAYPIDYVGWYPDPLMPTTSTDIEAGTLQPYWVTVYVPRDARPGTYRSRVWVRDDKGAALNWPLTLTVWNLDLPWPSRLKTAFSILPRYDIPKWYGWDGLPPPEFRTKLYELLFEHRLNPMSLYTNEMWPPREDMEWCVKRGLNALNIRTVNDADPAAIAYVKEQADWLKEHAYLPLAYVYGFDEAGPDRWPALKEAYAAVRQAVPGLPRASTVAPNPELDGSVDIWVPLTAAYNDREAESRRRAGNEVWWYICCGPWHPYANWFIDYPATDARVLFWQTYKHRVTGFLYYEICQWRTNMITEASPDGSQIAPEDEATRQAIAAGKRWPDIPWNTFTFARFNGDGFLVYPGPGQTPLPSLRLEVIRDGIEDYDLLCVLADLRKQLMASPAGARNQRLLDQATEVLAVRPTVASDITHFTDRPEAILRERQAVARTALRIRQVLGE